MMYYLYFLGFLRIHCRRAQTHTHTHTHTHTTTFSICLSYRKHNANHAWTLRPGCVNSLFGFSMESMRWRWALQRLTNHSDTLRLQMCDDLPQAVAGQVCLAVNVKSKPKDCYFLSQFLKVHDKEAQQGSDCVFHSLNWTSQNFLLFFTKACHFSMLVGLSFSFSLALCVSAFACVCVCARACVRACAGR